jgi:hypothetical protein
VAPWLIASFGLPVVMTTGRRMIPVLLHPWPGSLAIGALSLSALMGGMGYSALVRLRRRRVSRRTSTS